MGSKMVSVILLSLFVSGLCSPIHDIPVEDGTSLRVKRATCDILSFEVIGFKFNHSACAVRCKVAGKSGGWCDDQGKCNCR
ncbi:unnamed protein product [Psylliodes chrysocephalus]|uniref:Invertebrate defensins family profile domain-containing protein n=1 Tax=Psylliodes chrysocephalus TaxID=3402493 RepID=A0A9P0CUC6_9CUCU|nr:unnamed protein product [Psylliodes chrysocephala]